ncbi:ATP-binding cassette ChvD family protein [Kocuria sp. MT07]
MGVWLIRREVHGGVPGMSGAPPAGSVAPATPPQPLRGSWLAGARRRGSLEGMAEFIYTMNKARKKVGDKVILDDVTMSFFPGAKIGVVGPNGAGKSTILKIMAGLDQPSNGEARLSPGYSVGILLQEPPLNEEKTVLGNVEEGVGEIKSKLDRFNEISAEMAEPDAEFDALMEEMGKLQEEIDAANAWDLDSQLEQAMDALRCPPPDADVKVLSGGERRRVALCKLLLEKPDLLLLDEPTNHLDAESVLWLEQHLASYPGAVLAVTHDRYFLDHVAEWICEVDRGRLYPYEGNYSTYLDTKAKRMEVQGKKDAKQAKRLKDELEWVRSNAKGRQTKSKSRLARYEEMAAEAEKTRKLDFEEIQIPPGPRLGNQVIEATDLKKGFGDRSLIDGLSFSLPRNGIVGVIGPNGVGKSTLFKTIVGLEELDGGELKVGDSVQISYVDQGRANLDPEKTLWEVVSDGLDYINVGKVEMPSRAYVSAFGFKGPDQQKKAGVLSGGERNRLNLALTLKQGGNLLLLDEPTNDLDVETLGSLENALLEFPGCAVVVSHDRWFLDRVATHILAWEGTEENPDNWYWFEGNFEAYEENKVERLGAEAARPKRLTHRRLTRD